MSYVVEKKKLQAACDCKLSMPNGICTFFSLVGPTGMLFVICELTHDYCVLSDLKSYVIVFEKTFYLKQYMKLSHVLLS